MVGWLMNDKFIEFWSGCGLIKVLSQHSPGKTGNQWKPSVRIAGILAKIQTKNLPKTSVDQPVQFFSFITVTMM
jgi:hypothetical protein